ncbi:MAG TPA: GNAT family N-acetyltransferase [Ramlibacter sp.]|nr:GNAT family N-acetyltransferase [Ramlibacter sp.]
MHGESGGVTSEGIEAIERATLAAVAPEALEEIAGWLLPFDSGTVGRAKSAVPVAHTAPDPGSLREIEERYAARALPAVFRIPSAPAFDGFGEALARGGYAAAKPTQVHIAATSRVRQVCDAAPADIAAQPDAGWAEVFLGEGFDPVDGASRVRTLSRATGTLFASVRRDGRTVAAGAAAFGHGWASVHGMRTAQACRGQGLAARVLASLAAAALARGYPRMFLQVEAHNPPAQALYRRAGFEPAWTYTYWRR